MTLSRPATRAGLSIVAVMLSIAAVCGILGPQLAWGMSPPMSARHARCAKATHGGHRTALLQARRAVGRRCKANGGRRSGATAEPSQPAPQISEPDFGSPPIYPEVPAGPEISISSPPTPQITESDSGPASSDPEIPAEQESPENSSGSPTEPAPISEPPAPVQSATPFRFFSPNSFWNEPLAANAPLDPSSAAVIGAFDEEIAKTEEAKGGPAAINTTEWSVPIYTVPADQPTVEVKLTRLSFLQALQTAWSAVPLPPNAQPAAGTDEHLVVWQPSTDRLWEFWGLVHGAEGWRAAWGGAMQNASSNRGAYGPEAWLGAKSNWGASASSLSIAGGLITFEDLELDQINHALAISIPHVRGGVYASPAQRTDGWSTKPLSLPEGAHLRLDPKLNLAALNLPPLTLMMAEAAQRYGIVVRDRAANVTFYAQDPTATGTNPYTGTQGYFEGKSPQQLLKSFPWSHLQLLEMELHSTS